MPTNQPTALEGINTLPDGEAEIELLKCCGSNEWARQVVAQRPFESVDDLFAKADRVWWSLESQDWLEAFQSHPKIGEQQAARATAAEAQKWSTDEQSGVRDSTPDTIGTLAKLNRRYEEQFGHIFIVCATGKSAEEMLAILRARLENPADRELRIAAVEQAKITELRLKKLVTA